MRVGIIADILCQPMSGMGRYISSVLEYLVKNNVSFLSISKRALKPKYTKLFEQCLTLSEQKASNILAKLAVHLWRHPRSVNVQKMDIVHCPTQSVPLYFWFLKTHKVVTIHGVATFELSPEVHRQPNVRDKLPYRCFRKRIKAVITVSNSAKKNIARHYDIDPNKIHVIYHGVDHSKFHLPNEDIETIRQELAARLGVGSPYLLHVSNYQPKKNVIGIVKAFKKVIREYGRKLNLVLAGGEHYGFSSIQSLIEEFSLESQVMHSGRVPDKLLAKLLMGAQIFLFPSFHEGFGLPILEAMACGTPVITSNIYSMPEVAGDAAILVDPTNVEEIAQAILTVLENRPKREEMVRKGLERVKQFTWEKSAREHLEVYRKIAETK